MNPGHRIPNCDGQWIDVSTLSGRRLLCTKCRGTVDNLTLEQYSELSAPKTPSEPELLHGGEPYEGAGDDLWFPLAAIFIVACALSGLVGFLFGRAVG